MRGREVTRLEGFSDAVFGFALTLLVVSLEVPEDLPALKQTLSGFLPFAATFAVVSWIWFEHYLFFLRYKVEDNLTVLFNLVLLFVVAMQTYSLVDKVASNYNANLQTFELRLPTWPFLAVAWAGDAAAVVLIAIRTYRLIVQPEAMARSQQDIKPVE